MSSFPIGTESASREVHMYTKSQTRQSFRTIKIWMLTKFLLNSIAKKQCLKQSSSYGLPEKVSFSPFKQLWSGKQH